ncbi:PLP-dependent aspartate aminotransferase family protein [Breoghania sp. L-A4]|uniref:trans-sulfuration enzyme family protein n=1 Tax=Breoghania sp. L-A4 TaxID=2304600 RepID=UPI000E35C1A9|nr:PLP-dependent aspartate aminotransferase family protein [Breoghania sp. L-A4]AXS40116.1 PLP-dependent transferase [Breoghania sp. L-A4]
MSTNQHHVATLLAHANGTPDPVTGAVVPGIAPATTFARGADYALTSPQHLYARDDNDLFRQTEGLIARLENAAASRLFASGMAAISSIFRTVPPGAAVVLQSGIYWGTTAWARKFCKRQGIALVEADSTDGPRFCEILAETNPDLVFIETPANPGLGVTDIALVAEAAHEAGAILAVDATAATPLLCKPLDFGADLVAHSATKAMNGHSDLLAGVVSTGNAEDEHWKLIVEDRHDAGAVLGSFECWLLLRGLRTLALRVERMSANAQAIAEYLESNPAVERVLYPGLESHPGHEIAQAQMSGGYGSLLSFLVKGDETDALAVAGRLKLILRATSLGGVESLVEHRYTIEGDATGVAKNLLRLSVGIEHPDDLIADLQLALGG